MIFRSEGDKMNQMEIQIIMRSLGSLEEKVNVIGQMLQGKVQIQIAAIIRDGEDGQSEKLIIKGVQNTPQGIIITVK